MQQSQINNCVNTLKLAIIDLLASSGPLSNSEIAEKLNLHTSHQGAQKDYLTYSLLGELMLEGKIQKKKEGKRNVKYELV